jgi:hypothetical protein
LGKNIQDGPAVLNGFENSGNLFYLIYRVIEIKL